MQGVLCLGIILHFILNCHSGYIITTPRKWISNEKAQICVTLDQMATPEDVINVELRNKDGKDVFAKAKQMPLVPGERSSCYPYLLASTSVSELQLSITGTILGNPVNHTEPIVIASDVAKTYVQTDKFLYKPGQMVRFRVLTVIGPFLKPSTEQYDEIWIENPSGSRIRQWLNVTNEKSLRHLEFQLTEEPEEGSYNINVKTPFGTTETSTFKVEEYVLPRYEVVITKPNYILGTTPSYPFTVCAKYTFGQPVKGNLTFTIHNNGWGSYKKEHKITAKISGCETVTITNKDLDINNSDYFAYSLVANANVEEDGTGVTLSAKEESADITRTAVSFEDLSVQEYLKPELPYSAEIKSKFPDGSAAANEPMKVCSGDTCKDFNTDVNGILKFIVPPHLDQGIYIRAVNYPRIEADKTWRSIMYESSHRKNFKKYHSPSNSSIIINLAEKKVNCDAGQTQKVDLPIRFSAVNQSEAYVTVQVVSRGQVQFSSTTLHKFVADSQTSKEIDPEMFLTPMNVPVTVGAFRGTFTVSITLPETVSPMAKLVVWYVREDGEVVSDFREVDVSACLSHAATLEWSVAEAQPGDQASLKITALPDSICSLGVVDKSVELLSSASNELTVQNLLDVANRGKVGDWEVRQVDDYEYCKKKEESTTTLPPPVDGGIPPIPPPVALPVALPAIARQKRSSWRPNRHYYSDDVDAIHGFDKAGLYVFSDLTLETRPCRRSYGVTDDRIAYSPVSGGGFGGGFEGVAYSFASPGSPGSAPGGDTIIERTYFPETWLWSLHLTLESGVSEETLDLPDTVTEWVGRVVCVNPVKGVGLSGPSSITTFRDFFADLTLPATVKRGEILPVKISVFNYLKDALPLKVELRPSPEYEILPEEGLSGSLGHRSSCLKAEDKDVLTVRIRPLVAGEVNITIDAYVDINTILPCGTTRTEDRFRRDLLVKPITVEIEGFPQEKTYSKYACAKDLADNSDTFETWELAPPADIVADSARGFIAVVGDLMGPTIENLGKLVKMPYGCGEQNMLNFAPNIFVMQYLDASDQNTPELSQKSITYMEKGYQRELNYRHDDGSFSAFGNRDASGSTWLTAFVLKSFSQARPYIAIDPIDLKKSADWLKSKQLENGCFESVGKVLHKGMKGGLAASKSLSLLSAFVVISLIESGEAANVTLKEALYCLTAEPLSAEDPYALAVRTLALALANDPKAKEGIDALIASASSKGATLFWDLPATLESSEGAGVETAAYAVLAMLTSNVDLYSGEIRRVIKWMNNQRNGQGGFKSTQDTIIALQAMAAYEKSLPQGPINLSVMVDYNVGHSTFVVNEHNKLLLQTENIPSLPTTVSGALDGDGCALVQATLRYNIPEPEPAAGFAVNVVTTTEFDPSCKTKRINACASYTLEDKLSNMAILEVNLISGYIPEKKDLKKIVGRGTGIIKRYEVDGSTVTFYFDELSAEETCISFRALREVDVEEPKKGTVKVYDYYKPELSISKSYTFPAVEDCQLIPPLPPRFEGELVVAGLPVEAGPPGEAVPLLARLPVEAGSPGEAAPPGEAGLPVPGEGI